MYQLKHLGFALPLMAVTLVAPVQAQNPPSDASSCKTIHATLVEDQASVGCKPGHSTCFLGEVSGNHGLRGTTYFRSDSGAAGPGTSPGFRSYSGLFEYQTANGTLIMRETGVVNTTVGNPESGAVTAFQKIIEATGDLAGATGYLFVSGFSLNQHVDTLVMGQICFP